MPSCPVVNTTHHIPMNDTQTIATLAAAVDGLTGQDKVVAESAVTTLNGRVTDLKNEVKYMTAQLGDWQHELDRTHMDCLCNPKACPSFLTHKDAHHDIAALCGAQTASVNG